MTFRDYLRVARERRVLVVATTLIFVGAALFYSLRATPLYEAEAALEFRDLASDVASIGRVGFATGETPEQRSAIAASTLVTTPVLERAADILKLKGGAIPGDRISAQPEARTNLVVVLGQASSAKQAAALTNAVAEAAVDVRQREVRDSFAEAADAQRSILRRLKRRKATFFQRVGVEETISRLEELASVATPVVLRREASVPDSPIAPKPIQTTLLGLLIGLTVGLVAAFVRDSLDRRFKSSHEITDELHMPLLGYVPENALGHSVAQGKGSRVLSEDDLEGFRVLRTNIEFLDVDNPPKVLLVTSALPQEGKSTVATGLAAAYAVAGKRTLVVECDLRRPTLATRTGISPTPGLTDYLAGRAEPQQVLQSIAPPSGPANGNEASTLTAAVPFVAITAGSPSPQPAEMLRSKRCSEFLAQVRDAYDVVLLDTCPLLSVADTLELLPAADAVIICVRASKTTRDQAKAAKAALAHFPTRPSGVVLTGARAHDAGAYPGYYSYGYVYGSGR